MPLKIIDDFTGRLTRQNIGDMNSGLAKYETTFGNDPFSNPSNLQWFEQPTSILSSTNFGIAAAKVRLEGSTTYVYTVDDGGGLNKIQVNDTSGLNPNYDQPSVIGTLTQAPVSSTLTLLYGSSIQFYGATQKMFIGTDFGVTKVNFTGAGESSIATTPSSIVTNVPRPSAAFLGKMYWGNGNNILEIDSTETITTYAKLTPGFPSGTYVRDLDVTPDGNYLQITVSNITGPDLFQIGSDATTIASSDAYRFLWNGTDTTYTSYESYPGYSLTANTVFGQKSYTMGTDLNGSSLYDGATKVLTLPQMRSANFGATFSTGNLFGLATTEYNNSIVSGASVVGLQASGLLYGQYDSEIPGGLFRMFRQSAAPSALEVIQVPVCLPVSNLSYTYQSAGYTKNIIGSGKLYFGTVENKAPGINFVLYKFMTAPTGVGPAIQGVYETQQETSLKLFRSIISRKFKPTQVRFYVAPLIAGNSFSIDIIGSSGNPMPGGSQTFTVGSNANAGQDYVWYTPYTAPTYSMGFRISNLGTVNWTGYKLEVDYEEGGY